MNRFTENYELSNGTNNGSSSRELGAGKTRSVQRYEFADDSELILTEDQLGGKDSSDESDLGIILPPPQPLYGDRVYFRDGKRKIDYVLVYEEITETCPTSESSGSLRRKEKQEAYRHKFLGNLTRIGLELEEEVVSTKCDSRSKRGKSTVSLHFIKLSAPWSVLINWAEQLNLRAPLQAHPSPTRNWSDNVFRVARIPNILDQNTPNSPLDYYTCPFKKSKIDKFLGSENTEEYFTATQRIKMVNEILQTATYGKRKKAQIGINRLVEEGIFAAAYPLHDGPYQREHYYVDPTNYNKRQILYEYWAKWSKWFKYQPLDHIRDYFGEKIAMYFAWLGFYTAWLLPAALVGFLVFMYGVFTLSGDIPSKEICNSENKYKMCPDCEGCEKWYLSETCFFSRLSYLFDHPGTVFYSVFVSFWAVAFLEYWKRKSASLAHHWDCTDYEKEEEKPRPEFAARAPFVERNPVTGLKEPSFPRKVRFRRMVAGSAVVLSMLSLVLIFIVAVIIYRIVVSISMIRSKAFRGMVPLIASTSGALLNLILIMALGRVFEKLAYRLTQWEMHRTQTQFENHLTLKVFIFEFFNFYSSIFYIAFFKGRFAGYPQHYTHIMSLRNEECSNSGCLMELAQQLAVIMIGKQVINNAQEIVWPKIKGWWHRKRVNLDPRDHQLTRWEEDFRLIPYEGLFDEYLEMVLQFGFITIFVAAFPLAPLFALLNNWVEIRLDANKLVAETRRPSPERAQNIGIWFSILTFLCHLAVISNAFLIAFTSDFLPKSLYAYESGGFSLEGYVNFTLSTSPANETEDTCRYRGYRNPEGKLTQFYWKLMFIRFAFVCVFEHFVFSICRLIDILVPDIPKSLELKIKRERYLAKQALADSDAMMRMVSETNDRLEEEGQERQEGQEGQEEEESRVEEGVDAIQ